MRTLNPAMKFVTLLCVTFVLAFRYNPVLNLAVFVLCMAALLVSKVRLKTLPATGFRLTRPCRWRRQTFWSAIPGSGTGWLRRAVCWPMRA